MTNYKRYAFHGFRIIILYQAITYLKTILTEANQPNKTQTNLNWKMGIFKGSTLRLK